MPEAFSILFIPAIVIGNLSLISSNSLSGIMPF